MTPFLFWPESKENRDKFLDDLHKFHPNLNFTYKKSKKNSFLIQSLNLQNDKIITDLVFNVTDSHQFLHNVSCRAEHTKEQQLSAKHFN